MANLHLSVSSATMALMDTTSNTVDIMTKPRPTVTPFLTTSAMVPDVTSSISSASASSSFTHHSCLEWGDGAGPCARPYGRPNSTPDYWYSDLAMDQAHSTVPAVVNTSSAFFPIGVPTKPSDSFPSATDLSPLSSFRASLFGASACEPTTTVTFTITASEPNSLTALAQDSTTYDTATSSLGAVPMTTIAVAPLNSYNGSANGSAGASPMASLGNLTMTSQPTGAANGSGFNSPGLTAATSGGDKVTAPKPLGMGGSSSGNGVYCVVMLVALAALLT